MEEGSNGERAFNATILKRNNGKIFVLVYRLRILTNTYPASLTSKQVVRKVLFLPCLIGHTPLSPIKTT